MVVVYVVQGDLWDLPDWELIEKYPRPSTEFLM